MPQENKSSGVKLPNTLHTRSGDPFYNSNVHQLMANRAHNHQCMWCGNEPGYSEYYCDACLKREYPDDYKALKEIKDNFNFEEWKKKGGRLFKKVFDIILEPEEEDDLPF